jgi:hypothetical protein
LLALLWCGDVFADSKGFGRLTLALGERLATEPVRVDDALKVLP